MEAQGSGSDGGWGWNDRIGLAGILGCLLGFPAFWSAHSVWTPAHTRHVLLALAAGAVPWLLVMGLRALMLRGRPDLFAELQFSGIALAMALPFPTAAGLIAYNGVFDTGQPTKRVAFVRDKMTFSTPRLLKRGSRDRYYLVVGDRSSVELVRVARRAYYQIKRHEALTVEARPGSLGWPWDERGYELQAVSNSR